MGHRSRLSAGAAANATALLAGPRAERVDFAEASEDDEEDQDGSEDDASEQEDGAPDEGEAGSGDGDAGMCAAPPRLQAGGICEGHYFFTGFVVCHLQVKRTRSRMRWMRGWEIWNPTLRPRRAAPAAAAMTAMPMRGQGQGRGSARASWRGARLKPLLARLPELWRVRRQNLAPQEHQFWG